MTESLKKLKKEQRIVMADWLEEILLESKKERNKFGKEHGFEKNGIGLKMDVKGVRDKFPALCDYLRLDFSCDILKELIEYLRNER